MKSIKAGKFRKGAASFYVVAFSTLILVIIAASFAAVVVSEITRTSNDDLAQSAYDSALAGVEDAKLAFYNYRNCLKDSNISNCSDIIDIMRNPEKSCYMTGRILGRLGSDEEKEVTIQESNVPNNMYQAYTCVKIDTLLSNYKSTLNESNPMRVMTARFGSKNDEIADQDGVVNANRIKRVKISWFSDSNSASYPILGYNNILSSRVVFPSISGTIVPPTISLAMLQTATEFNLSDFETTVGETTDRGMIYLVPTDNTSVARGSKEDNYIGAFSGGQNYISKSALLKSNDKTAKNLPYVVYCKEGSDYFCEATIELPEPVDGERNNDTFVFITSLPYGKPETDFMLEFFCDANDPCSTQTIVGEDGAEVEGDSDLAYLDGVQVEVDSTGRANDLFRRVEVRLEGSDAFALSLMGPLELFGDGDSDSLVKNFAVTSEWNFR